MNANGQQTDEKSSFARPHTLFLETNLFTFGSNAEKLSFCPKWQFIITVQINQLNYINNDDVISIRPTHDTENTTKADKSHQHFPHMNEWIHCVAHWAHTCHCKQSAEKYVCMRLELYLLFLKIFFFYKFITMSRVLSLFVANAIVAAQRFV